MPYVETTRPGKAPTSYEVYRWPEFLAFAERLGIAADLKTNTLSIHFDGRHEPVRVVQEYVGHVEEV